MDSAAQSDEETHGTIVVQHISAVGKSFSVLTRPPQFRPWASLSLVAMQD